MRSRSALLAALVIFGSLQVLAVAAHAQETDQEDEGETQEGQGETETETGEEEEGGGAVKEEGPPWTYQMVWISIFLLLLVFLAIGGAYYRFVILRQRGEV